MGCGVVGWVGAVRCAVDVFGASGIEAPLAGRGVVGWCVSVGRFFKCIMTFNCVITNGI